MKKFSPRRTLRTLVEALENRRLFTFSLVTPIPDVSVTTANSSTVSLANHFHDSTQTNTTVLLHYQPYNAASAGANIYVQLTDSVTPLTVANFLSYVNSGAYNNTIIHRSVPGFVVQGGGYQDVFNLPHITTAAPVANEFTNVRANNGNTAVNLRGTLAMAKSGGDPDSATSEFFFNLADNSSNLDNQNGGFTTFATVRNDIGSGMTAVDTIAALQQVSLGSTSAFTNLPIAGDGSVTLANLVTLTAATAESTYAITGNTNASLFSSISIVGSQLVVNYAPGHVGSADLTVTATDFSGNTATDTFTLTATQSVISVADGGTVLADAQSTAVSMGTPTQGTTTSKTFRVTNNGNTALTFGAPTVPAGYVITSPADLTAVSVAAGDFVDVTVTSVASNTGGAVAGTLVLNSNDPDTAAFHIPLTYTVQSRQATVSYNSTGLTSGQSTAVNFGSSSAASFTATLTVKNNGTGLALGITSVGLPGGYSVVTPLPSSIAAGASASLVVSIDTTATGTVAGTITIHTDDPVTPAFSFPVTAAVNHAVVGVALVNPDTTTTAITDNQSTPVDYGFVDQNAGTPNSKTFRITNTGNTTLTFSPVTEPAGFFITSPNRTFHAGSASTPPNLGTLAPGDHIDIVITQRADTGGDKSGVLTLNTNDPNTPAFDIPLAGFTHFRKLAVSFASANLVANGTTHTTPAVNFGTGVQGDNSYRVTFHVTNTGDTLDLTLAAPTLPAGLSVVTALPATLAPGASADLVLAVDTSAPGTISDTIVFNSGDPLYTFNPVGFRVPFTATILYRRLAVTDASGAPVPNNSSIPFGTILQGNGSQLTFHVANTGNLPLTLSNPVLPAGFSLVGSFPTSIAAGSSADITLALDSLGRGNYAGAFTFTTDDVTAPTYTLNLTGKVVAKGIVVSLAGSVIPYGEASTIDFGKVRRGATGQQITFTILNSGALPLSIQSTQIPVGYTLVQSLPDTLASGASTQLTVSLDTTNPGFFNGSLHIVSSDPDRPSFDIPLTAAISLPVKLGAGGAPSVTFTDADGTTSTLTLAGPGSATLDFFGNNLKSIANAKTKFVTVAGSSVTLGVLTTAGTSAGKSKLAITSKGGNKSFDLAAATGSPLLSFSAPNAKLTGTFNVKAFALAAASALNATITLPAGATVAIPTLANTTITTPGNLKSILFTTWNVGTLTASSVDSLTAAGAVTRLTVNAKAIGTLNFKAALTNSTLGSTGQVKSVTTKSFTNSSITGKAIATLALGTVKSRNGGVPFGVTAASVNALTAKLDTGKSLKLAAVNNKTKLASQLAAQKVTLNDFKITLR